MPFKSSPILSDSFELEPSSIQFITYLSVGTLVLLIYQLFSRFLTKSLGKVRSKAISKSKPRIIGDHQVENEAEILDEINAQRAKSKFYKRVEQE